VKKEAQIVKATYIFVSLAERITHLWTRQASGFAVYKRTRSAGYAAVLFGLGGQWTGGDGEEGEEDGGDCELHLGGCLCGWGGFVEVSLGNLEVVQVG